MHECFFQVFTINFALVTCTSTPKGVFLGVKGFLACNDFSWWFRSIVGFSYRQACLGKFVLSLVVPIAIRGAQNRLGGCSKSPRLVLKFVLSLVVPIAIRGAQNRLGWCSKSPRLVLKIASAGAQNRLGWCSKSPRLVLKFVLPLVVFFHVLSGRMTSASFVYCVCCSQNYAIFFGVRFTWMIAWAARTWCFSKPGRAHEYSNQQTKLDVKSK